MADAANVDIDREAAQSLSAALARLLQTGADERALVDLVGNTLRLRKAAAWPVVETFQRGYHAGVGAAIRDDEPAVPGDPPMYAAAFAQGYAFTGGLLRNRAKASRIPWRGALVLLLLLAALVWIWWSRAAP